MDSQRAAEIQVVLEGIRLPAGRQELIRYAAAYDGAAAAALERIPKRQYRSLDEVGEVLNHTQPRRQRLEPLPRPESGPPPGGKGYTTPFPESGAVELEAPASNPAQKVIEQQSETLKRQAKAQSA